MFRFRPNCLQFIIAILLALATLTLYLTWLAPSVAAIFDDSLEFQLVTYRLGIAHPTGYPLYTLLGKLFTFLPVENVAYRINLMSAVFGSLAVGLVYLLGLSLVTPDSGGRWPSPAGAALGAIGFGLSPVFAGQATIAEVYTLNAAFVAATLWLAVQSARSQSFRCWLALAFVYGLSLTHHRSMLLLLPATALYLVLSSTAQTAGEAIDAPVRGEERRAKDDRPTSRGAIPGPSSFVLRPPSKLPVKRLVAITLAFSLPLLLYLYLPLRGHVGSLDGVYRNTWGGFWQQVSGGGYGVFIFGNPFGQARDVAFYLTLFRDQFGWFGWLLAGLGLVDLGLRRQWTTLVLTAGAFLTYSAFNVLYTVSDIEVFFIPAFLIGAVWLGQGAYRLGSHLTSQWRTIWRFFQESRFQSGLLASRLPIGPKGAWLAATWYLIAAAAIFLGIRAGHPAWDRSGDWAVHDYGLDVLSQPLPPDAAIVGILGEMTLLRYFQETMAVRPDLQTVVADLEADRLQAVERLLADGKTVFLTRPLPGAAERWSLSARGPLIEVQPQPVREATEVFSPVGAQLTPEITLLGYTVTHPAAHQPVPPLRLTLFWQALAPVPLDLKISARLQNETGAAISAEDAVPVHFAYPTTAWRPGEIVRDVYDLMLPPEAQSVETVTPLIILYDPARNAAEVGRVVLPSLPLQ